MEIDEDKLVKDIERAVKVTEDFGSKLGEKADKAEIKKVSDILEELQKDHATMKAEKIGEAVKEVRETFAKMQKQFEEMQENVSKMRDGNQVFLDQRKSIGQLAIEALVKGGLKDFKYTKGNHQLAEFKSMIHKVVANMGTGNVTPTTGGAIPWELASFEPGLTHIQRRAPWILNIANVTPINTMYAMWAEEANPDGVEGTTAEGVAKNKIDFDWVEKSKQVVKYTAFIKTSKESLSDLPGLSNEIDTELRIRILLSADAGLLTAVLAGDTAFDGSGFTGGSQVSSANFYDVIRVAINQSVVANFVPNYVLMHPTDVAKMELTKDNFGQYVLPPFKSAGGMVISGAQVLENPGQTVDNFTVGDFTKLNVRMREELAIDIGLDADDFTKNLVTVLGETRFAPYIKTNHAAAFISGDFTSALALITAP